MGEYYPCEKAGNIDLVRELSLPQMEKKSIKCFIYPGFETIHPNDELAE